MKDALMAEFFSREIFFFYFPIPKAIKRIKGRDLMEQLSYLCFQAIGKVFEIGTLFLKSGDSSSQILGLFL